MGCTIKRYLSNGALVPVGLALAALGGGLADAASPGIDGPKVASYIQSLLGGTVGDKVVAAISFIGWLMAGIGWLRLHQSMENANP